MNVRPRCAVLLLLGGAVLGAVQGCASSELTHVRPERERDLLPFLEPGETSLESIREALGRPRREMQGGRLLAYRMALDEQHQLVVAQDDGGWGWRTANYSLVLLLDDDDTLKTFRLIQVKGSPE